MDRTGNDNFVQLHCPSPTQSHPSKVPTGVQWASTAALTPVATDSSSVNEAPNNPAALVGHMLRTMDPRALRHLMMRFYEDVPAVRDRLHDKFLVPSSEVREWKESDDQERFDDNGNEKPILLDEESEKENKSTIPSEQLVTRYATCERCRKSYDTSKNANGLCKFHPGELAVGAEFEAEWEDLDNYRYRQWRNNGYDVDDDEVAYEEAKEDAEKFWTCCEKEEGENDSFCMVSRHRGVNFVPVEKSGKRKR